MIQLLPLKVKSYLLPPLNQPMTKQDTAAIKSSIKAYKEILPLLHAPDSIKQVSDAIKFYEALLSPSQP